MNNNKALYDLCLRFGDTAVVLGHRLSELCGKGPFLEEDVALTNIALDHIGRGEALLDYAAELENKGRSADDLAYRRNERQYKNALLAEQPNTDFGFVVARQFLIDAFNVLLYHELAQSSDTRLAGIAAKAYKESLYHLKHSGGWVLRLGQGTEESRQRIQQAFNGLWRFCGDLFASNDAFMQLAKQQLAPSPDALYKAWLEKVENTLETAGLSHPLDSYMLQGSMDGIHTEHLGHLLAEMQYLPRAYPDAKW